ncbi:uncharacterized protein MELLADRAFT_92317 [Melampsora larici-populina 98AG31]|uniref:Uncharacterized protein n=1 Tax=Melampsora larici-populina (strain 98AG31 / pathotype 3-4-7) TaxID=747676 RepID=F4R967_MELLP|nr:uncharacterized protein MELLADRAFT_92317 [Melampsora larici-populina 98AG31]EGG10929.1 hypothetical protein MELLADRAFT_92317 [Melampsora larici-populina 98AG31]
MLKKLISIKMREIKGGPWDPRICSDGEFDHAIEAMERRMMNRAWHLSICLLDKRFTFRFEIRKDDSDGFSEFANTELLKINNYNAPRDKMICILNCSKVIFDMFPKAKKIRFEKLKRAEYEATLDALCLIFNELKREVLEVVLGTHHGQ